MRRRTQLVYGVSLVVLALGAGQAVADPKLAYGPVPAWVAPVEAAKPDPLLSDAPLQVLLRNQQVQFGAQADTNFTEIVLRVQTTQGLQAAQSSVTWNPDTDVATINKAVILRDGKTIDLLQGQTYTILRRETNIDRSMLDGLLTGVLQPEGLQVGDTLDYAMTIERRDPVYHGNSEELFTAGSSLPVVKTVLRAFWGADKPVQFRQSEALSKGKVTKTVAGTAFALDLDHYKDPDGPELSGGRFNQGGYVEFSQFATWSDVSRLMAPLYDTAASLGAESPLKAEAAKIRAASSDPVTQAGMALRLVESNVRYLFLGMNQGGYVPVDADTTWQRRFGDCKGKAALLLALLRELGISADVAAVSTGAGDGLETHLPGLQLFDHVIVRAEIAGKVYWMDATRIGDRDLGSLQVPPYVWALPLRVGGSELEALKVAPYDKPETETSIRLDASAGLNVPARAHVEIIYRYDTAIGANLQFQSLSAADREKNLKQFWTQQYNWLTPTKVSASFDAAAGELHVVADGDARMEWDQDDTAKQWQYITDEANIGWGDGLTRKAGPHKDAPMRLNFPNYYLTREEIVLPKDGKGFTFDGTSFDKTVAGTEFHRSVTLDGHVFRLEASKRSLVPEIPYAEAAKVSDSLVKMWNDTVTLDAPLSYKSGAAKVAVAAADDSEGVDALLSKAAKAMGDRDATGALASFNAALRIEPDNVRALVGRGLVFMVRDKPDAALADCQQAVKIDATTWIAYNCIGQAYSRKADYGKAVEAYSQALANYPNSIDALQGRAAAYAQLGDKDKARADAQAAVDLDPAAAWAVGILAGLAMDDGKPEAALTIVDEALAANPDDSGLLRSKIAVLETCRGLTEAACKARKAGAVALYDKIIAANPNSYDYALRAQDRLDSDRAAAMADLDAAIKLDAKDPTPYLVRASLDLRDKDDAKALVDVNAALAVAPGNAQGLQIRSQVYFRLKRYDEAIADIDAGLAKAPNDAHLLNTACWERATHNLQLDKAFELCSAGVKAAPKSAHILDSLAFVELRMGRYDDSVRDYDAALAIQPDLGASLYGRGLAKLKAGKTADGNADLAAARKLYPKVDDVFKAYGVTP